MTTLATGTRTLKTTARLGRNFEELVDGLMAALFSEEVQTTTPAATPGLARSIHEARWLRQARLDT